MHCRNDEKLSLAILHFADVYSYNKTSQQTMNISYDREFLAMVIGDDKLKEWEKVCDDIILE